MSRNDAALNKVRIIEDVYLNIFTDRDAKHQDSITVIVQDGRAVVIDTAFPEYAERVKKDLEFHDTNLMRLLKENDMHEEYRKRKRNQIL